ncbi:MAG TPA: SRPBCC family protein [Rubrobacteraceae bacterium]
MKGEHQGSVDIEERIYAPAEKVAYFIGDFRNAKEWMVGVEAVEMLGEDHYRLTLDSPIGTLEPEATVVEHGARTIRWVYASVLEGGGRVEVSPDKDGCTVNYKGEFHLRRRLLDRAARLAGVDRFARKNGERSLSRLKHLMEAHRY